MWNIYVLFSEKTGRTYIGCSKNIQARLNRHNSGRVKATRNGCPWRLIYKEGIGNYSEVRGRERYFKSGAGRRYLAKILSR